MYVCIFPPTLIVYNCGLVKFTLDLVSLSRVSIDTLIYLDLNRTIKSQLVTFIYIHVTYDESNIF